MICKESISGIILAGGKSRRMGYDKSHLKYSEKTFFETTYNLLKNNTKEVYASISVQKRLPINVKTIYDPVNIQGPLAGIYAALKEVKTSYIFVLPVDMPFVSENLVKYIISNANEDDNIAIAKFEDRIQPLIGIYSAAILPLIEQLASKGVYKVSELVYSDAAGTHFIDCTRGFSAKEFANINTQNDLEKWSITTQKK